MKTDLFFEAKNIQQLDKFVAGSLFGEQKNDNTRRLGKSFYHRLKWWIIT
jgi:hypothetical protein